MTLLRKMQGWKFVSEKLKIKFKVNFIHSDAESDNGSGNIMHTAQLLVAVYSWIKYLLSIYNMCIYWTLEKSKTLCGVKEQTYEVSQKVLLSE